MVPPKSAATLSQIVQRIDDHVEEQEKQFNGVDKRLEIIELEMRGLLTEKGTKMQSMVKLLLPILISVLIVAGGWIWGLSRQESAIADLQAGRYENKGNIALLQKQLQDGTIADAVRDEQYKQIIEKLGAIQKQLERIHGRQ